MTRSVSRRSRLALASWQVTMAPRLSGAEDRVVAPGAKLEKLAGGFAFTEGPTCDAEGNLFFTDQPNDRILKWSVEGKLITFLQPGGPRERHVLRPRRQSDRLRRRKDRPVVHRAGRQGHGDSRHGTRASP